MTYGESCHVGYFTTLSNLKSVASLQTPLHQIWIPGTLGVPLTVETLGSAVNIRNARSSVVSGADQTWGEIYLDQLWTSGTGCCSGLSIIIFPSALHTVTRLSFLRIIIPILCTSRIEHSREPKPRWYQSNQLL